MHDDFGDKGAKVSRRPKKLQKFKIVKIGYRRHYRSRYDEMEIETERWLLTGRAFLFVQVVA